MVLTGAAASISELVTFPLDITKTRLQLQQQKMKSANYKGMTGTMYAILKEEGIKGLYQGLPPAVLRHLVYTTLRINIYENLRAKAQEQGSFSLQAKVGAGAFAGAAAQLVASPCDLVKVRLQAQGKMDPNSPNARKYTGTANAFKTIFQEEGLIGLWKGVGPNVYRAALVNLGELATYDQSKQIILQHTTIGDNVLTHTVASVMSGLIATICSCPADVVKTRMMNQNNIRPTLLAATPPKSPTSELYKNSLHCLTQTIKKEGFLALYKGFLPTWARLGPWQLTFWVTYEQLRKIAGLNTF
jgi:solute carrier family 25 uncoupling protein 27